MRRGLDTPCCRLFIEQQWAEGWVKEIEKKMEKAEAGALDALNMCEKCVQGKSRGSSKLGQVLECVLPIFAVHFAKYYREF